MRTNIDGLLMKTNIIEASLMKAIVKDELLSDKMKSKLEEWKETVWRDHVCLASLLSLTFVVPIHPSYIQTLESTRVPGGGKQGRKRLDSSPTPTPSLEPTHKGHATGKLAVKISSVQVHPDCALNVFSVFRPPVLVGLRL